MFEAYEYPSKVLDTDEVTDLMPTVDQEESNHFPLFQVKGGKLHRKSNVHKVNDGETTTNW